MAFTIDREELAWAAGFFDGEGSPYLAKKVGTAGITIGQTDPEVLERFVKAVGLGSVSGPYGPYGSGKKPMYYIRMVSHWHTQHVAAALWQWLGTEKKQQFLRVLRASLLTPARPDRRTKSQVIALQGRTV